MRNTKQNEANIKSTPKMALRARKAMNQEGNTPTTPNLQENNENSRVKGTWNQNEWNDKQQFSKYRLPSR